MKIKHATIANFKGIGPELEIDFTNRDESTRQLTCLIGDNGSGKTTILQAIALVLSLATRRTRDPAAFDWHGFLPERVSSLGKTHVELTVSLDDEEVEFTTKVFNLWLDSLSADWKQTHNLVAPSEHREIQLVYENGQVSSPQGFAALTQFLGRYYVKSLLRARNYVPPHPFSYLGDVFWFDHFRNLGTSSRTSSDNENRDSKQVEGWQSGVEQLREYLVGMWSYHTSPDKSYGKDFIAEIETQFTRVFPGVRFKGTAPKQGNGSPSVKDFYFLLERDGRIYDFTEMSSGEQAVFPLIYEFTRLDITKSIVLIDELELHLHPPQQQALLAALPKLGSDCQYLITTHSEYLTDAIPDEHEVRLRGGKRCL